MGFQTPVLHIWGFLFWLGRSGQHSQQARADAHLCPPRAPGHVAVPQFPRLCSRIWVFLENSPIWRPRGGGAWHRAPASEPTQSRVPDTRGAEHCWGWGSRLLRSPRRSLGSRQSPPPVPCRPRTAAPTPTHTLCGRGCGTTKLYGSPRARGDESQGWFPLVKPTPNARAVPCPGRGGGSPFPFPLSQPQAHFRLSTFPIFLPSPSLCLRSPSRAQSRGVGGAEEADPGPRIIFFRQPLG